MRTSHLAILLTTMLGTMSSNAPGQPAGQAMPDALRDAPSNTWVRAADSPTGGRDQPIFVYAAGIERFVIAAGFQARGGTVPRHYDTEEFDLATGKWVNAYPRAYATTRPESGPVGEEYSKQRERQGYNGFQLFYKDGEFLRLSAGGQWVETTSYYEYCYAPADGKVYAYLHDKTLRYDPAKRTWEDLGAAPRTSCRVWGSMCYDPVKGEIVHAGGDGGSLQVGTWVYNLQDNEWRKRVFGPAWRKDLHTRATELTWQAKALLGAAVNRFTAAQTEAEAKADLKAQAGELADATAKFNAGLPAKSAEWAAQAAGRLDAAEEMLKDLAPKLAGAITPEIIAQARAARVLFEQAADAMAIEPPGRARSQIACDLERGQIVLFGGDQLDRLLTDTWVYDCASGTWEQKFPAVCPAPRAGHILAWLPKSKKFVLAGGYGRPTLPQEVWTYDVAANEWKLLLREAGPAGDGSRGQSTAPRTNSRTTQVGAANDDDVLVCVESDNRALTTWACKVDPTRAITVPQGAGGRPGDYAFNRIDPADWEKVANPDPTAAKKLHAEMPANQWTALKFARYAPGARNRWGTTAYDTDRHQFLFWGGGHATSHENDVAHFSVLGSCWTLGYHPDDPIEVVYASQPTPISFHDRVHVPVHAYKAYCYDPTAGKMHYFDRAYDPAVREWEPRAYPGLSHRGPMHSHVKPTPHGAVTFSDRGLFRFDAKAAQWVKLPWDGPNPGRIWCDGDSLFHDAKRDCLWLSDRSDVYRYDMATGKAEKVAVTKPKVIGQYTLWGEQVYLPGDDLVLLMRLFPRGGGLGNVVWDPNDGKFYWADLKFVADDKEVQFKSNPFSWHDALAYDPELKLVLLNNSSDQRVWAMRFDRKSANLVEVKDED